MEWLWIVQLVINALVVVAICLWLKERNEIAETPAVSVEMPDWQELTRGLREESLALRRQVEGELKTLAGLCERTQSLVARQQAPAFSPSLEEEELRALKNHPVQHQPAAAIPSVHELEVRKQATRPQMPLDLRSLLRDQLS